ncbi:hypothetical protein CMUST_08710 [Corynebacterium mustelae]|uniref:Secreted protein n=1 Tax=Corynebacterium mustelae TaxID=571915 RepID=A0A0G3GY26_9CORY|nr:hypothetical protein [Corynebacterium mustelae]AKK06066.1 hypothetical protein CMUST_08710 [Corynebacterium mustelae]
MKLFSRKAVLAVTTAAAVSVSAFSPAIAQEDKAQSGTSTSSSSSSSGEYESCEKKHKGDKEKIRECNENLSIGDQLRKGSRDDTSGNISAKKIGEWIAIIGTIITVMTSVLTFVSKVPNLFNK